jgi:DNA-binding NtrC family response regulator
LPLTYGVVSVADEKDTDNSLSSPKPITRLLVVDDEKDILIVLRKELQMNGVLVDAYTNPSEALEHFRKHPMYYRMVVSDIRMPGVSGFDLAKQVRKMNPNVKIILVSSFEIHKSEFDKVMPSTRVDDFVQKPFRLNQLKSTVLKHLRANSESSQSS